MRARVLLVVAAGLLAVCAGGVAAMLYQVAVQALEWWDQ